MNFLFIILLIGLGIIGGIIYSYYTVKKRQKAMAQIAARLGLTYHEGKGGVYYNLNLFSKGDSQKAFNTISGSRDGCHVALFDYTYTTGSGKSRQVHYNSVCVLGVAQHFKTLFIRPENFLDKIVGVIGFDDIDFESREFSSRFYVKSDDKKFAYDIVHPQMMDFLLNHGKTPIIEMIGTHIGCYFTGMIRPEAYMDLYKFASDFYKNIPDYVLKDCVA